MFVLLGFLLALYVLHGLFTGVTYAKAGVWGRSVHRHEDPLGYWAAIGCYSLVTAALLFWF